MEEEFKTWLADCSQRRHLTEQTFKNDLSEALYTISENNLLEADARLSFEDAILIWELVERLRQDRFPDDLKM